MQYLELEDYLLIAEAVLGLAAEQLARVVSLSLAESALAAPKAGYGAIEFYPDPAVKAGILCARLIRITPRPMETSGSHLSRFSSSSSATG